MMKYLSSVLLLLLLLVSCATVNPYTDEKPFVANIGSDGDYVFTTTKNIINIDKIEISRISGCYSPETGELYGAVEGNFSKALFNTAMKFSGKIDKTKLESITAWYDSVNGIYYYCPAKGIVLFSNKNIETVYERTFKNAKPFVDSSNANKMISSELGFFVRKPYKLPDIGFNIPQNVVSRFETVCAVMESEIIDVNFVLSTNDYAKAFFQLIKASIIGNMVLKGEKPDLEELKRQITNEGNTVSLKEIPFSEEKQQEVINNFIKDK